MNLRKSAYGALAALWLLAGCGKALEEENARLKEQVAQLTELNGALTSEKQSLDIQIQDLTERVRGLEAQNATISAELAAKQHPAPSKKRKH